MKKKQQAADVKFFTSINTVRTMYDKVNSPNGSNAGAVGILKPSYVSGFNESYQIPDYQLFRLENGFGIFPDKMGNACFGYFCADGERCRMERYNFIGIADEETTRYAAELEAKWNQGKRLKEVTENE